MLLPIIDIVVALIGTFVVMKALGFSLNNLSLFGLVLAVGIVVDDSIVVVENIERWMGMGLPAREATIKAMDEITGPVIGITLVLAAVFIPTAFIPGLTGAVLPPVRADDRHFRVHLGHQRLDDGPGPGRGLDQAARRRPRAKAKSCREWESPPLLGFAAYACAGRLSCSRLSDASSVRTLLQAVGDSLSARPPAGFSAPADQSGPRLVFAAFQQDLRSLHAGYTRLVGLSLRLSVIVLVLYAGLLGLDRLRLHDLADRLHSRAGSGIPARQRRSAGLRFGAADERGHRHWRRSP